MVRFTGAVRPLVEVLEPERELRVRAVHVTQIEDLLPVGTEQLVEYRIGHEVDGRSRGRDGTEDARLVPGRAAFPEDGADGHLAKMGVLSFADRIHPPALADEAAHGGILVPDVPKLDLRDLPERVMGARILQVTEEGKLADQLAGHRGAENVECELGGGGRRAYDAQPLGLVDDLLQCRRVVRHHYLPASLR